MIFGIRLFLFAVIALCAAVSMPPARYCFTLLALMFYGIISAVYGWEKHKEATLTRIGDPDDE